MPNRASAKKRLRQNEVHRERNRTVKSALRTTLRKCREAIEAGNLEEAEATYLVAQKKLDQAGACNIIHPNAAARTKSRLRKRIKAAQG